MTTTNRAAPTACGASLGLALTLVLSLPALSSDPARSAETSSVDELLSLATGAVEEKREELVEVRHDLHRHPEPSGEEERTAGVVAERLRGLGLEVRTGVGGHGVAAVLEGGAPGPTVAYRADMDAMPSTAPDPVAYRSEVEGVRHICGHDVHTTVGLAVAEGLAAIRERLAGSVVFVFQPAEETASGARAMLADGVFDDPSPTAAYGLHTAPLPVGQLAIRAGVMMPGRDNVTIRITGSGELDAVADAAREAILGVLTVTAAQAGAPQPPEGWAAGWTRPVQGEGGERVVSGLLSIPDEATRAATRRRLAAAVEELETDGVEVALEYEPLVIAGIDNDEAATEHAVAAIERALGAGEGPGPVLSLETLIPAFSEDFGSFQQRAPGAFFFLGVSNPEKGTVGMPHSPSYVADDEAIFVGAKAMTAVLLDALAR